MTQDHQYELLYLIIDIWITTSNNKKREKYEY
jgi:hypothetical protein